MKRTKFTKTLSFFLALVLSVSCISYYGMKSEASISDEYCPKCGGKHIYEGPFLGTVRTPIDSSAHGEYIFSNSNINLEEWHYYLIKCENFSALDKNHEYYPSSTQHRYTYEYVKIDSQTHKVISTCTKNSASENIVGTDGCGYSKTEIVEHSVKTAKTLSISDSLHSTVETCICGHIISETPEEHSFAYTYTQSLNNSTHRRKITCSVCGYYDYVTEPCYDEDGDDKCDVCNYPIPRFSVSVPTTMYLSMASNGKVYSSDNCSIVNRSTAAVTVKRAEIHSLNGWKIVPYSTKPAYEKVDSKEIGFRMNGKTTQSTGNSEVFDFGTSWNIPKGSSYGISYSAVVSAVSAPVNEDVLNIVFIVEWRT